VEDDLGVELSEVISVVNTSEVFVVMFAMFERRLLVDARTGSEGPLIRVVDRVRNSDERFRELQRMRPRFPAPDRIVAFPWPRSIRTFVESGVWDAIQQRMSSLGAAESTCVAILAELRQEERREEVRAVRGEEPYQTMRGKGISLPLQPPARSLSVSYPSPTPAPRCARRSSTPSSATTSSATTPP
jgi:hypothetical protein